MTIFQDKLLTRTYCNEAEDYGVPSVLSPRDLFFRPDLSDKYFTIIICSLTPQLISAFVFAKLIEHSRLSKSQISKLLSFEFVESVQKL